MRDIQLIKEQIEAFKQEGKRMFATSSFQTHSIPMLHIISEIDPTIPVYYMNTGFLFPETLEFKDQLSELLGLKMVGLRSHVPKLQQRDALGNFYFTSDPDYCCAINKTQPLEPLLAEHDIWINGIRADQSKTRAAMKVMQPAPFDTMRYHPMLDWNAKDIYEYREAHNLPEHPLETSGYLSIGCEPCTRKYLDTQGERAGRWFGMNKTECGLHTDLVEEDTK